MSATPATNAAADARATAAAWLETEIRAGLAGPGHKRLPCSLLYDALGSELFEAICLLPEYGLTRAEERILHEHGPGIARFLPAPVVIAELGSGSGRKTRSILEALAARQWSVYYPIDISAAALERCARELGRLPGLRVEPIEADYLAGLGEVSVRRRAQRLLVLFLGSTIGNFDRPDDEGFLREVRRLLRPGDRLLLGTDLVKPVPRMLAAYDDALGVTAAFNRNVLARLNRELGADFDLDGFAHQARWHEPTRRIEMHLVARRAQQVTIEALDLRVALGAGESIWTESSYKYDKDEPLRLAERSGFQCAGQWRDAEWPFADSLFVAR